MRHSFRACSALCLLAIDTLIHAIRSIGTSVGDVHGIVVRELVRIVARVAGSPFSDMVSCISHGRRDASPWASVQCTFMVRVEPGVTMMMLRTLDALAIPNVSVIFEHMKS